MGYDQHELSVVITDDAEIMELNQTYRGIGKPTNVLAFPMLDSMVEKPMVDPLFDPMVDTDGDKVDEPEIGKDFSSPVPQLLGDLVISLETAQREADEASITLDERLSQLMVHGILHLVGFDHELGQDEAVEMEEKSLEILRLIETNPNLDVF